MATAKRRDAGAAERTSLENWSRGNATGGSNPPLSPPLFKHLPRVESVTLSTLGSGLKRTAQIPFFTT